MYDFDPDPLPTTPAPRNVRGLAVKRLFTLRVLLPRCPYCRTTAMKKYRSLRDLGDGTSLHWMRCLNPRCASRFRVHME